jgi:hypothetical protein
MHLTTIWVVDPLNVGPKRVGSVTLSVNKRRRRWQPASTG